MKPSPPSLDGRPAHPDAGSDAAGASRAADLSRWFAEQLLPHEPLLRSWLRSRFGGRQDIDDIVQEAYLRLLRARAAGEVDHPKAYLFHTARNAAIDRVRRERVVPFERLTDSEGCFVLAGDEDAGADSDADLELLAAAVRSLPPRCREVLVLRKYHGLSHEEIAVRLGITRNTVNAQITAAMIRCRQYFRDHGLLKGEGP